MELYNLKDTICAVATPPGVGGISIIRISGDFALNSVSELCLFLPAQPESHRAYYGHIKDADGVSVDEVIVTYFEGGRSFTGENTYEISCHGNQRICNEIIQLLIKNGARLAHKGEFTYRAFTNGRIDLVQAESVLSLIQSSSKKASSLSLANIEGSLSKTINNEIESLTHVLANFEANIDFSTQDIEVLPVIEFKNQVSKINETIMSLIDSFEAGKKIHDGINIALIGLPNAGKSSLLNNIIGREKAIVTDIPGTTRDLIEDFVFINGMKINLLDTAGIHQSDDPIEKIGILKSIDVLKSADYILYIHDSSELKSSSFYERVFNHFTSENVVFLNTKIDLPSSELIDSNNCFSILNVPSSKFVSFLNISNINKDGFSQLNEFFYNLTKINFNENSAVISQSRHYELLKNCSEHLLKSLTNIDDEMSPEFIAIDLHTALRSLYSMVGREYSDQVMDKVFQSFCIGK